MCYSGFMRCIMKGVKKYICDKFKIKNTGYVIVLSSKLKKRMFIINGKMIKINKDRIYSHLHDKEYLDTKIEELSELINKKTY